ISCAQFVHCIDVSSILAIRYTLAKTYISILHDENFSFLFLINYQVSSHLNLILRKPVHLFVSLPLQRNAFFTSPLNFYDLLLDKKKPTRIGICLSSSFINTITLFLRAAVLTKRQTDQESLKHPESANDFFHIYFASWRLLAGRFLHLL